jgi:hypothetical protein
MMSGHLLSILYNSRDHVDICICQHVLSRKPVNRFWCSKGSSSSSNSNWVVVAAVAAAMDVVAAATVDFLKELKHLTLTACLLARTLSITSCEMESRLVANMPCIVNINMYFLGQINCLEQNITVNALNVSLLLLNKLQVS